MNNFENFNLQKELIEALNYININIPTPIQGKVIAPIIEGKDIIASSQTGSGKTLAYLLPITSLIMENNTKCLVLVPTRELAIQVELTLRNITKKIDVSGAYVIGGEPFGKQVLKFKKQPNIIIGTPGRILDHLRNETLKLNNFNFLIVDEVDRMLEMGMKEQIDAINQEMNKTKQILMFSATMPKHVIEMSKTYLKEPMHIKIETTKEEKPDIDQKFLKVNEKDKFVKLKDELEKIYGAVIIFVNKKKDADILSKKLNSINYLARAIHGDLRQETRERVISSFRNNRLKILVATDIAARGLDISHVEHVINYDLPMCTEDYIHRIGRTGRAGAKGFAISFINPSIDHKRFREISKYHTKFNGKVANFI
jgi:ATP-dependent RNA helicase DeaD